MKLSTFTFFDTEVASKISCGKTKEEISVKDVLGPYSVELILPNLTNNDVFYSISTSRDEPNHGIKKMFPLALKYFDLEMEFQIVNLISLRIEQNC